MAILKIITLLALLPFQALALPAHDAPIPGYRLEEIEWEVEVFPGQGFQNFTGTIEKVHNEVRKINPRWEPIETVPETAEIEKRYTYKNWAHINCGGGSFGWNQCLVFNINKGIDHLRSLTNSRPRRWPGPGACGRVSCSWNAGIFLCNDNRKEIILDSWGFVADAAQEIVTQCQTKRGYEAEAKVVGQAFSRDYWNVIVRSADC